MYFVLFQVFLGIQINSIELSCLLKDDCISLAQHMNARKLLMRLKAYDLVCAVAYMYT